jgi:hypothetical protein
MTHKKIVWKSWNTMAEEYINGSSMDLEQMDEILGDKAGDVPFLPLIDSGQAHVIYTPWGAYPVDSMLKPSDRWDCRIGYTNFSITNQVKNILVNDIDGIEALKILGKYSFAIGIPCTFDFKNVRLDIEKKLCTYTEEEVLKDDTKKTVDLVKQQLKGNKYWSILVTPGGNVDYIVSDIMDRKYLDGLHKLFELKQNIGGIILRGDNG